MFKRFCLAALAATGLFAAPKVIAVDIDGVIHPITVDLLAHALDQAASQGAAAVLLRLNTPGGLLDATRQMNEKIVASRVPVIAYVTPSGGRAASAGFFILEAADVAAMAPGTNTGASSPVALTGQMDETMRHKVENDASAWLRSTVEKRGRNVDAGRDHHSPGELVYRKGSSRPASDRPDRPQRTEAVRGPGGARNHTL